MTLITFVPSLSPPFPYWVRPYVHTGMNNIFINLEPEKGVKCWFLVSMKQMLLSFCLWIFQTEFWMLVCCRLWFQPPLIVWHTLIDGHVCSLWSSPLLPNFFTNSLLPFPCLKSWGAIFLDNTWWLHSPLRALQPPVRWFFLLLQM